MYIRFSFFFLSKLAIVVCIFVMWTHYRPPICLSHPGFSLKTKGIERQKLLWMFSRLKLLVGQFLVCQSFWTSGAECKLGLTIVRPPVLFTFCWTIGYHVHYLCCIYLFVPVYRFATADCDKYLGQQLTTSTDIYLINYTLLKMLLIPYT